jgi:branched-chain amino acid transport system ATP-binding protein
LAPALVAEIFRLIDRLRANGIAILLSEQNAQMTLAIADRAYVIETGSIVLQGRGRELLGRPEIAERYLGIGADSATTERGSGGRHARLVRGLADIFGE